MTFSIEMGRDRTGRVVDPDNSKKRLLTDNKDVDTWVCILEAGIHGVDAIQELSNSLRGWMSDDTSVGGSGIHGCCSDSSTRASIFRLFLDSGRDFISRYPDKEVQLQGRPHGTSIHGAKPPASATTSIRTKAHDLFEKIISFVLRTLPVYPIMIPHVPNLMWFGRSSPWEHKFAQDVDVLGAAENPRFRERAAEGMPLKSGAFCMHGRLPAR